MPVKTRNMTRLLADTAIKNITMINFDDASREWRQNKHSLPNGCFSYKIQDTNIVNKDCKKYAQ